ncbi:arsenite efflux transporter metallochaperone ArsD [Aliarcobacter cryaerophilus]|uniref:Arsenical resistance operon transcriptional repressor ArsD n=1 Tax=Aliarcobacter cryaerophilus TaxID=28198 RepID=A0A2S9TL42_9BACT|nr:arsenite efflux transporter metallochaperone ArsD [Aliarcobacter cryaerophilus]PRM99502.1 arsenical resistance operon transcriptional repressor ArsD [Arcobacter cryaerophilus gv. crypticus]
MKTLKIYDPAMCCPTGVCGTSVDTKLVQLSNFLNSLDKNMFTVKRFGLSTNPQEYVTNSEVSKLLNEDGVESLPLIFLDDELLFKGDYPTVPQLSSKMGLGSFVVKF